MNKNVFLAAVMAIMMIATVGFASAQESTNPVLKLQLSTYDPIPAEPGQLVDVWINVQNIGGADATNIDIEFVDTNAFKLISDSNRHVAIPVLGAFKDYQIKYTIKVSESVADGQNDILLKYKIGNTAVQSTAKVTIDVKSAETSVAVTDIQLNPSPVEAGGKTTLTFDVANLAKSSSIRNVDVTIQMTPVMAGTTLVDLPFVTVNSGNQKSIDRIPAGQSGEFSFDIAVYPEAESKIYKLPVTLSYYDDTGRQYNKTILVGVEVNAHPDLLLTLDSTELNTKNNQGTVLFNIINRGTSNVKLMTITLKNSNQYTILSPSNELYLGNIDSDDFETARFNVKTNGQKDVTFDVELSYRDSLNNEYTENRTITYQLQEPTAAKRSSFPALVVLAVVIIGIVMWYRRRRAKNK